jgi:antagonist of KipI
MANLHIVKPGLLTTIQDVGRWGFQSRGVPVAGPMDPRAHGLANALVGNDRSAATLEVTLIGPEVTFEDARFVAVAGADFALMLDERRREVNTAFEVTPGSRLRFGSRASGARAYLAVEGGLAVAPILGSRSTHLVSRMGGLGGRALTAGDRVPLGGLQPRSRPKEPAARIVSAANTVAPVPRGGRATVRVLPASDRDAFDDDSLAALQSAPYVVAIDSDRMGFRLQGPRLGRRSRASMISDATPLGTLQVPDSEQPLLLMADRQTTGGYPRLATVITADIGIAGQLGPGDRISFEVCSHREAIAALIALERNLMAVERAVNA